MPDCRRAGLVSQSLDVHPDRIFVDATYTIGSGKSSGIERVVRNVLHELQSLGSMGQIPDPILIVSHDGQFFPVHDAWIAEFRQSASMQSNVLATAPRMYVRAANVLCNISKSRQLRKWLLPQPGHLGLFKVSHTIRERSILAKLAQNTQPIVAGKGDLFILPDAYWVNRLRDSVWPAAVEARCRGAFVASLIYDLIPLTHPEFVGLKRRDAFRDYLHKAAQNSDLLISISDTVRDQLSEYLSNAVEFSDGPLAPICSYQLGAEIRAVTGRVRPEVRKLFDGSARSYLTVAAFDPRKNHGFLLDAFDLLWQQQPDLQLCLVGRIGSRCDDFIERLLTHPRLGKQLHFFDDLTDVELQHCYRDARAVIFPSIVEGFGLPIVESLWFGRKTFASDTAIHREVGRSDCCYFGLDNPTSLADSILDWEDQISHGVPMQQRTRRPTSWRESCEQLLAHCLDNYASRSSSAAHQQVA